MKKLNEINISEVKRNIWPCRFFVYSDLSFYIKEVIISKRYMAGWREVCDQCSTTLFNYHYMCKECGYILCIECFNELTQISVEKRKSTFFKNIEINFFRKENYFSSCI